MTIPELPEEILCYIFARLKKPRCHVAHSHHCRLTESNWENRKTLRTTCLASKVLYRTARPSLYHSVDIWENAGIRLFTRTIVREPALALLVRELELGTWESVDSDEDADYDPDDGRFSPAEDPLLGEFLAASSSLSSDQDHNARVRRGLERGYEDAEISLVMARCVKLETLAFNAVNLSETIFLAQISLMLANSNIRHISANHCNDTDDDTAGVSAFQAMLRLPRLHSFSGVMIDWATEQLPAPAIISAVKDMRLEQSLMSTQGIYNLLQNCPQLKTLSIVLGDGRAVNEDYHYNLDFAEAGTALRAHGRGIEFLHLDVMNSGIETLEVTSLGSLAELESLRVLSLPPGAICTVGSGGHIRMEDALPASIKVVNVRDWDWDIWDTFPEIDEREGSFDQQLSSLLGSPRHPNLHTVRLHRGHEFDLLPVGWTESRKKSQAGWHRELLRR